MARRRQTKREQDETLIDLVEAKENAQSFFEKNQMAIIGIAAALAIVIGGYFIWKVLISEPAEKEAMASLTKAQQQFEVDSFALALESPGAGFDGFLDIIDNYGGTKAGNLANYYAGISYLNLGNYEVAVEYLSDFSPSGNVSPIMKFGALGDAYSELNETDKALSSYKKAAYNSDNTLLTPYYLKKYGMLSSVQGKTEQANDAFNKIKKDYPNSTQAKDIEKYLR